MRSIVKMISTCPIHPETVYSNLQDEVSTMKVDLLTMSKEDLIPSRQVLAETKEISNKE